MKSFGIIASFCFMASFSVYGDERPWVNILSWWGYLEHPEMIRDVEKTCNVRLSHDTYYSNTEFLRRWHESKHTYDIVIFSDTLYKTVEDDIKLPAGTLKGQSLHYHPVIKKKYLSRHYPPNVAYFLHSLTGFLWNPKVVMLSQQDTINSIFSKAKTNLVIMVDDPVEVKMLLQLGGEMIKKEVPLTLDSLKEIAQQAKLYVTNDYNQLYQQQNFAFAFLWSGEAIQNLRKAEQHYEFLVHPKLSYISTDLLAALNNKKSVNCVAEHLTGEGTLNFLQNKMYYLSPYAQLIGQMDPMHEKILQRMIEELPTLHWISPVSKSEFGKLGQEWEMIKTEL